jgi:hypothetical protein
MDDPYDPIPAELSPGLLADLLVAWAEGEVSEGWMAEVTNIDPFTLRGMKNAAIARALAWGQPRSEDRSRRTILEWLDGWSPEKREEFFALSPEWRSTYERHSAAGPMTDEPSSSP